MQKTYGSYKYTAEITGGNTTKQTVVNVKTGAINYEVTAEYYTGMPNKTNLNIFEYDQFDHILSDNELFGKKNTHLLKKVTRTSANKYVYEYTYNTDANGYITSYTLTYTVNGGVPSTGTYKFTYL
ncbi:MAG: hypothetical protein U0V75_10605 [Ferruginibacter sp.]